MTKLVKKSFIICVLAIAVVVCAFSLTACDLFQSADYVAVESIQVTNSIIYMSPYGEPSTAKIQATVLPSHATNQGLTYQLVDSSDGQYVTVSSDGELIATKEKADGGVLVNVFSHDNRSISRQITVYVEEVAVSSISFPTKLITVTLGEDKSAQVQPIFTPAHAVLGRNVTYSVINPTAYAQDVITVDEEGYITPVSIGVATVQVATPEGELEKDVFSTIQVEVVYGQLAYIMNLGNDSDAVFKQIVGKEEPISLSVSALNENCNQNPDIKWYIDNTALNYANGSKTLEFTPTDRPFGSYVLKAKLTDTDGYSFTLISDTLYMYDDLTGIDLNLTSGTDNLHQGDIASIQVSHDDSQYPPESYFWYLCTEGEADKYLAETDSNVYNYKILDNSDVVLKCVPIIKGIPQTAKQAIIELSDIQQTLKGTDIYGLFVDATEYLGEYLPHIMWDVLPYDTSYMQYTVELINDVTEEVYTFTSNTAQYAEYFTLNGFMIPEDILGLGDSFTARVKTNRYGYSEEIHYTADTISTEYYQYLDTLVSGTHFNSYFATMEELGELINYISLFRPEELTVGGDDKKFAFSLYTNLDYLQIKDFGTMYPVGKNNTSDNSHAYENARHLVIGAFTAYADTARFNMGIDLSTLVPTITLTFESDLADLEEVPTTEDNMDAKMQVSYGDGSRTAETKLTIDKFKNSMAVETSNQLYVAVSMGYKPMPVANSSAEEVYDEARAVLLRIIDDSMTDPQKIHAIYDYLTTEVVYDYELVNSGMNNANYRGFHLEGVFLDNIAVCDGIAKAFTLLTMMEGIKSVKVVGQETRSQVGHAWNLVFTEGGWYAMDATWGSVLLAESSTEVQTHYWMLTTDRIMEANHITYGKYYPTEKEPYEIYYANHTANTDAELEGYIDDMIADLTASEDEYIYLELRFHPSYYASVSAANGGSFTTGIMNIIRDYLSSLHSSTIGSYGVNNVAGDAEYLLIKLTKK